MDSHDAIKIVFAVVCMLGTHREVHCLARVCRRSTSHSDDIYDFLCFSEWKHSARKFYKRIFDICGVVAKLTSSF
ncbi:hypothetical protein Y032_0064g3531 [Ancylostoma ceylanicum]|uniref:Uncharacterized protein n=1 Tax=Ancylostoma ceylanicum TaxID=53326 RepID=A0A016U1P6_9BILA|nr:hypothetical protein Y032_0064g3531 [Ancylostoma ceylanicum]